MPDYWKILATPGNNKKVFKISIINPATFFSDKIIKVFCYGVYLQEGLTLKSSIIL